MASTLAFSTFDNNNNSLAKSKIKKNKTIKRKSEKVTTFLKSMEEDDDNLADFDTSFNPPDQPQITREPVPTTEDKSRTDDAVSPEAFTQMDDNQSSNMNYQNYYNTYVPYYNKATNNSNLHGSKDELMKKLNYMIHLLEENKDEKTGNVTEELVLYMFLGVFVIFTVDSFARAGKYTR
jgi:hypothetical protein|tara:strand:- start:81 stop:617 length:537 start_codon:yes stop_codon:yes gene_type:complete